MRITCQPNSKRINWQRGEQVLCQPPGRQSNAETYDPPTLVKVVAAAAAAAAPLVNVVFIISEQHSSVKNVRGEEGAAM